MGIALTEKKNASVLRLDGAIDISVAAELKTALLAALAAGKAIRILPQAVSELDVTAFQLLWAAEREAKKQALKFAYTAEMPSPVAGALSELGLKACGFANQT
jgi:ABC-type transporter Mla MlaB component